MSPLDTALIFAGIPLAALIVLIVLIFGGSEMRSGRERYRPGRPWNHAPVWYLPQIEPAAASGRTAIETAATASSTAAPTTRAVGGAVGEW